MKKKKITQLMLACVLLLSLITPLSVSTVEAAAVDGTYATVATSSDPLSVRSSPSLSSKVIGSLKKGTIVTTVYYLDYYYAWTEIYYKDTTAYVATEYLDDSINYYDTYSATVKINSGSLNVRSSKSTKNKKNIVGSLKKGASVTVYVKNKKGWATIEYGNRLVYVSSKYLKYPTKTYSATVDITSGNLNVRSSKSTKNKKNIIGSLKKGTTVTVYVKNDNGWATINYNNKKAYVASEYLYFD